jgi:HSP20 family molecular chaperone IbpA
MLNELMNLIRNDESLYDLRNRFWNGLEELRSLASFADVTSSSFKEEDGKYVLEIDVEDIAKPSNFNVDFDEDTNVLTVEYSMKTKNSSKFSSFSETLPADADTDTIDAFVEDGVFKVTVDKKVEVEEEEEEPCDDTTVKVNRKRSNK